MNKQDLINAVAESTTLTKTAVADVINATLNEVTNQLKEGNDVTLVGFGTFTTAKSAARIGRNPSSGAEIQIPAKTSPKFKPGKALKDAVN